MADASPVAPAWKPFAMVAGCPVEELANASELRAFRWEACNGVPKCEQSTTDLMFSNGESIGRNSFVNDDGTTTHLALGLASVTSTSPYYGALFTDPEGQVLRGYRVDVKTSPNCVMGVGATSGDHFGATVLFIPANTGGSGPTREAGIIGSYDQGEPVAFEYQQPFPGGGAQGFPMGPTRWLWWWEPGGAMSSVSNVDGNDETTFVSCPIGGDPFDVVDPVAAGPLFLFTEVASLDAGPKQVFIGASDGKAAPIPYLVPPSGSDYDGVGYAGSHVVWMRGIGRIQPNVFQAVELWASPFDVDPSKLAPFKVGDIPTETSAATELAGGHGYYAHTLHEVVNGSQKILLWNIPAKSYTELDFPDTLRPNRLLGITQKYLWMTADPPTTARDGLVRIALP